MLKEIEGDELPYQSTVKLVVAQSSAAAAPEEDQVSQIVMSEYKDREAGMEDDEENMPPAPDDKNKKLPSWFKGHTASSTVLSITVAGVDRTYIKRTWAKSNSAFLHGKPFRHFFREMEMYVEREKLRGYVVLGMYLNTHENFLRGFVAQCRLLPLDHVAHNTRFGDNADMVLLRILMTMCSNPRIDWIILHESTGHIERWEGTELIRGYDCAPDLAYDMEAAEQRLKEYYKEESLIYDPAKLIKRDVNPYRRKIDVEVLTDHFKFKAGEVDESDALWEHDDQAYDTLLDKVAQSDKKLIQKNLQRIKTLNEISQGLAISASASAARSKEASAVTPTRSSYRLTLAASRAEAETFDAPIKLEKAIKLEKGEDKTREELKEGGKGAEGGGRPRGKRGKGGGDKGDNIDNIDKQFKTRRGKRKKKSDDGSFVNVDGWGGDTGQYCSNAVIKLNSLFVYVRYAKQRRRKCPSRQKIRSGGTKR